MNEKPDVHILGWWATLPYNVHIVFFIHTLCELQHKECWFRSDTSFLTPPYATPFMWRFFMYHHAIKHRHTNIIASLFSIPFVLKCVAKLSKSVNKN